MPLFMTIHTLAPGSFSPERIREIARLGQTDRVIRGYRSFHSLTEGRIVWLLEAPSKQAIVDWCRSVDLPLDGVTALELEGFVGNIRPARNTIPNQLPAKIVKIDRDPLLAIVTSELSDGNVIVALADAEECARLDLTVGDDIVLLFRATNISLISRGKDLETGTPMKLSFPNQIVGKVTNIILGPTLVIVHMETPAGPIVSAIIPSAAESIDLKIGDEVTALFKALDVSLAKA